jgi:hypothetical protein
VGQRRRKSAFEQKTLETNGGLEKLSLVNETEINNVVLLEEGKLADEMVGYQYDLCPPSALEQAYNFINRGELIDYNYYIVRWRHYEQNYQFEQSTQSLCELE